jgi:uncharacterized protein (DUF1778 family)
MSIVDRRTLLSYYSPEEAKSIIKAANERGVSISNFIATAALSEATIVNSKGKK